jgi:hypothetical protein
MWKLAYPEASGHSAPAGEHGQFIGIVVECEFAIGLFSSESHKRTCEGYESTTGKLHRFDDTAY